MTKWNSGVTEMLEFILQLFGGRGAGSGNKGGSGGDKNMFGNVQPSSSNGLYTPSDLVKTGKTFKLDSDALYDKSTSAVKRIISAAYNLDRDAQAIKFIDVDRAAGTVTVKIKLSDGRVVSKRIKVR